MGHHVSKFKTLSCTLLFVWHPRLLPGFLGIFSLQNSALVSYFTMFGASKTSRRLCLRSRRARDSIPLHLMTSLAATHARATHLALVNVFTRNSWFCDLHLRSRVVFARLCVSRVGNAILPCHNCAVLRDDRRANVAACKRKDA